MVICHKNFDVYRQSIDFVEQAQWIIKRIPRGQSYLADQLKRAASSIVLNTCEGAGEFARKEKARFYRMALRSAAESAAIIDITYKFEIIDSMMHRRAEVTIDRIMAMLTKLVKLHSSSEPASAESETGIRDREPPLRG